MSTATKSPRPSFWQRWIMAPIRATLVQGTSPDQIAFTLAVGTACSLLPFLGFTSLFNLLVGFCLRLNQPILQGLNQLLGPLQLLMILVYVRIGERIWAAPPMPLSVSTLVRSFRESPGAFMQRFGWTGIHAATAWGLSTVIIVPAVYFAVRPIMRRFAAGRKLTVAI